MEDVPEGLYLSKNIIDEPLEYKIIDWLDRQPWNISLSRRTQHYGYEYNYRGGAVKPTTPMSGPILEIANLLNNCGIMNANQCIVNEYYRGQGISAHTDSLNFGPIICGLSIGDDTTMLFEQGSKSFKCFLPRRSLLMMTNDARYKWKHFIDKSVSGKSKNYRRISLTYRTVNV